MSVTQDTNPINYESHHDGDTDKNLRKRNVLDIPQTAVKDIFPLT